MLLGDSYVSNTITSSNSFLVWQVRGTDYNTTDGTCIRDYIHVSDLVDAHVKAMVKAKPQQVGIYNVGTGKGAPFCLSLKPPPCFW
jgi:UDP-glucose 4-epimerase